MFNIHEVIDQPIIIVSQRIENIKKYALKLDTEIKIQDRDKNVQD